MDVAQFDFELPEEYIALRPAVPRDSARMFVVREDGSFEHSTVDRLSEYLQSRDAIVLNDSKVIRARLHGVRSGRGGTRPKIEVLLYKRLSDDCYAAFARPARKLVVGDGVEFAEYLAARIVGRGEAGEVQMRFNRSGSDLDLAVAKQGEMPLPPYISGKRMADQRDDYDYQTVYCEREGSVAAPTAGLHFTPELLAKLSERGVKRTTVTLHVGPGTFLPVHSADTCGHRMHSEWASVSEQTATALNSVRDTGGHILAVGTTTLRTLESASGSDGRITENAGETAIFIAPGYRFRSAEILLTNFHLPRSTLFMLVSAFCGLETMKAAYAEAIRQRYRFYSYGDACLLFRRRV